MKKITYVIIGMLIIFILSKLFLWGYTYAKTHLGESTEQTKITTKGV
jgi:hypothetical protein